MRMWELEHMSQGEILSLLPPATRDVFDILSREGAIQLLDRLGGTRLRVPVPTANHSPPATLAFLTPRDFDALVQLSGGCSMWIPSLYSLRQSLRQRNVFALHAQRRSIREIAITLGITDRTVHSILRRRHQGGPKRAAQKH